MKKEKLIFVHIPKTAGTSIKKWVVDNGVMIMDHGHAELVTIHEKFPKQSKLQSFAVTRNTYERIVSYYLYDKKMQDTQKTKQAKQMRQTVPGFEHWLNYCLEKSTAVAWSQLRWIKDVDYVLSVENLEEDFKLIQKLTDCYAPLEKENVGPTSDIKRDFYSNEHFMQMIENHFADEIAHFGYKRPEV